MKALTSRPHGATCSYRRLPRPAETLRMLAFGGHRDRPRYSDRQENTPLAEVP